ncbi:MAG TPA: extracellular solute-binding protein, partial [Halococcus sp.]|nr:extracellular solute-binding protein [Halococcus sp.]
WCDNMKDRDTTVLDRRTFTTALGTGAAAALAGCSTGILSTGKSSGVATLEAAGWGEGVEREIVTGIMRDYDRSHENTRVSYRGIPGNYESTMKTLFAGGTEPDVFYLAGERCVPYMKNDALLDLTPYIEDARNYDTDDLLDNLLSVFQYEGGIYGIPKDFTSIGLYYNESHLEKAGVSGSLETWDDLRSALERIKARTPVEYPMAFNSQPRQTVFPFIFLNGGRVLTDDQTECVIGSKEAVEALEFVVGLHDDGLAGLYSDEISVSWEGPALGEGLTSTAMSGAWVVPTLREEYGKTYESIKMVERMPLPPGGEQTTMLLTTAWAPSATPDSEKAAAELIKALTSKQGMWQWAKTGIALPARQSLLDKPYYENHPILTNLAEFAEGGTPFNFGLHHTRITNTILSEVEGALTGVKSADAALKSAERLINNNIL